jgi:glycerol kinase
LATGPGQLVLAVLQGIAAQVAQLGDQLAVDLGRSLTRLRVDGGLTQSQVLMQCVADLMQIEIEVYPFHHATALGAVALGRLAIDPELRPAEAIVGWSPSTVYRPEWSTGRASDFRGRWAVAVEAG